MLGLGIERVADHAALGLLGEPFDELVVDLGLDEEPAAGRAALAAVEVDGVEGPVDGRVHVGVGEDDVGALAAQLEGRALERVGGGLLDDLGGIDVAGERDLVDVGVGNHGGAGGLAQAVDDVDHAGGEAGFLGELRHAKGRQRRLLGRLHHDRVAAGQGRSPFPGEHQQREVPGDDLADHADRLPQRVGKEIAANRHGPPFDLVGPARIVAQRVRDAGHVALRVADRLAAVERLERGQLVGILLDQVGQLEEQPAPIGGVHRAPRPGFQAPSRGLDGLVDVGLVPPRQPWRSPRRSPGCRSRTHRHRPGRPTCCR